MKKNVKSLLIIFLLLVNILSSCTIENTTESSFDFSSIEPFWKLVSILEKDIEPSQADWDSLLLTAGYKEFTSREVKVEGMKNYLRLGIMPSKAEKLKERIKEGYWDVKFPLHFQEVIGKKEQINLFLKELEKSNIQTQSIELTLQYFPDGAVVDSFPPISFIFFDRDARGYNPILVDALYVFELETNKEFQYLLAHEMHHYFRNHYVTFNYPPNDNPDSEILWVIDQIHKEGIADQIDKDIMFSNPANVDRTTRYQKLLSETPVHIHKLDSLLAAYDNIELNQKEIATAINKSAPMSGHPMGYFMAKTILKYQSKESLVNEIGNPFAFFYRYQEAAKKSNGEKPVFSDISINVIKNFETKYDM